MSSQSSVVNSKPMLIPPSEMKIALESPVGEGGGEVHNAHGSENLEAYVKIVKTDPNSVAIVITGPDTRDAAKRKFELKEHECCAAHYRDHYVFAMPKDYGLPKESDNQPKIEFKNYDLWGEGPIAILSPQEAAVIARTFLTRWFVFISKRSVDGKLPKEGYCFEYRDWYDVASYMKNPPRLKLEEGEYFDSDVCRALKVTVAKDERDFSICPVVVEKSFLAVHEYRLARVGTWQRRVWDSSAGLIPDAEIEPDKDRRSPQKTKEYPNLAEVIKPVDRLRLLRCHLFQHWKNTKETLDNCSGDIALISSEVAAETGNFRNTLVEDGCLNPSRSLAKGIYQRLQGEARKSLHGRETEDLVDWKAPWGLASLLSVLYPEELGRQVEFGGDPTNLNYLST